MNDVSLSPMHNAGIYSTHWTFQKKRESGEITKKKTQKNAQIFSKAK